MAMLAMLIATTSPRRFTQMCGSVPLGLAKAHGPDLYFGCHQFWASLSVVLKCLDNGGAWFATWRSCAELTHQVVAVADNCDNAMHLATSAGVVKCCKHGRWTDLPFKRRQVRTGLCNLCGTLFYL